MRIAFFTETFLPATDGVVTRLTHTIDGLRRMGDEVLVVAPRVRGGSEVYSDCSIYRVPGFPFPPYPAIYLAPPHPGIGRVLRRFEPDLIHAVNPFFLGTGGVFYAKRLGIPLVASYHTNVALYARYYGLRFLARPALGYTRMLHNQARLNLCTSMTTAEYLTGEGVKRVRLWPQGVDTHLFNPQKRSDGRRHRLSGGKPGEVLLLFVGRLAPEKRIERLRPILEEVPGVRLAIVGDGPDRERLEQEFRGTGAVFAGLLKGEELAAAYASSDVFVFPSTTETLGLAMLEAQASGLPVIAAGTGNGGEVIVEGETGLLCDPDSRGSLVSATRALVEDEGRRERMGAAARCSAESRSWEAATARLRELYAEAIGSS